MPSARMPKPEFLPVPFTTETINILFDLARLTKRKVNNNEMVSCQNDYCSCVVVNVSQKLWKSRNLMLWS